MNLQVISAGSAYSSFSAVIKVGQHQILFNAPPMAQRVLGAAKQVHLSHFDQIILEDSSPQCTEGLIGLLCTVSASCTLGSTSTSTIFTDNMLLPERINSFALDKVFEGKFEPLTACTHCYGAYRITIRDLGAGKVFIVESSLEAAQTDRRRLKSLKLSK